MELPEGDISTIDAIEFVQATLEQAAPLYAAGKYEDCWRFYTARGYEFLAKYGALVTDNNLEKTIRDDQPVAQFATDAWASRNAFRTLLRKLEQREDRILDSYLMQAPQRARFGR